jgi:hypothetical protein
VHVGKVVTVVGITVAAFYCMAGRETSRQPVPRGGRFDRWIKVENRKHPAFSRVMDQFV